MSESNDDLYASFNQGEATDEFMTPLPVAVTSKGDPVDFASFKTMMTTCYPPPQDRNAWAFTMAAILATNAGTVERRRELASQLSKVWPGYDNKSEEEIDTIWRTMPPVDGGIAYGSLYSASVQHGWKAPPGAAPSKPSSQVFTSQANDYYTKDEIGPTKDAVLAFLGRKPSEDATLPPITYHDREKTFPRTEEGTLIIDWGESGAMKTARALSEALNYLLADPTAKVVYMAGEGAHGIRVDRLPALCQTHGIDIKDIDDRWRTSAIVPLLTDQAEVDLARAAVAYFEPTRLYFDTVSSMKGAVDENSDAFGALTSGKGPIRSIMAARPLGKRPDAVVVHHAGRNGTMRGFSGFAHNADGVRHVSFNADTRTIHMHIDRLRDGEADFTVGYSVTPKGQVPVVTCKGRLLVEPVEVQGEKPVAISGEWLASIFAKTGTMPTKEKPMTLGDLLTAIVVPEAGVPSKVHIEKRAFYKAELKKAAKLHLAAYSSDGGRLWFMPTDFGEPGQEE